MTAFECYRTKSNSGFGDWKVVSALKAFKKQAITW